MQQEITRLNPQFAGAVEKCILHSSQIKTMPDGDIDIQSLLGPTFSLDDFHHPDTCPQCGHGVLKPNVVFFGESIPASTRHSVSQWVERCGGMVVLGTSLAVPSARRIIASVLQRHLPIFMVNIGYPDIRNSALFARHIEEWENQKLFQFYHASVQDILMETDSLLNA